jgi:hypothetical protein
MSDSQEARAMPNLLGEQMELLEKMIAVFSSGCRSEFMVIRLHGSQGLFYPYCSGQQVLTAADDGDFERLRMEGLLDLWRDSAGGLRGKPTARGVRFVEELRAKRADADRTRIPLTSVTKDTGSERRRRHGFDADMDRHNAIAEIVSKHAPDWRENSADWRIAEKLKAICADLDAAAAAKSLYEIPESWKKGEPQALEGAQVRGWVDALEHAKGSKLIVDQISNSLKMVRQREGRTTANEDS